MVSVFSSSYTNWSPSTIQFWDAARASRRSTAMSPCVQGSMIRPFPPTPDCLSLRQTQTPHNYSKGWKGSMIHARKPHLLNKVNFPTLFEFMMSHNNSCSFHELWFDVTSLISVIELVKNSSAQASATNALPEDVEAEPTALFHHSLPLLLFLRRLVQRLGGHNSFSHDVLSWASLVCFKFQSIWQWRLETYSSRLHLTVQSVLTFRVSRSILKVRSVRWWWHRFCNAMLQNYAVDTEQVVEMWE